MELVFLEFAWAILQGMFRWYVMRWTEIPIHVIDFEGARSYGVVEFGVVTLFNGDVVETDTRVCRAARPMEPREENFHGIAYSNTRDQAPFSDYFEKFSGLRNSGNLAAHHAVVENNLLKSVWPYPPFSPDFRHSGKSIADWGPWIDTRILYSLFFPQMESHKLSDLLKTFKLEEQLQELAGKHCPSRRKNYHCALFDALGAAVLLLNLERLAEIKSITAEWLIFNSLSSKRRRDTSSQQDLFE